MQNTKGESGQIQRVWARDNVRHAKVESVEQNINVPQCEASYYSANGPPEDIFVPL